MILLLLACMLNGPIENQLDLVDTSTEVQECSYCDEEWDDVVYEPIERK